MSLITILDKVQAETERLALVRKTSFQLLQLSDKLPAGTPNRTRLSIKMKKKSRSRASYKERLLPKLHSQLLNQLGDEVRRGNIPTVNELAVLRVLKATWSVDQTNGAEGLRSTFKAQLGALKVETPISESMYALIGPTCA